MTQENQQQDPIEEAGGYGTPTVEQEMPGGQSAAQPREEEASDAAGLSQDSPDGETSEDSGPDVAVPSADAEMDPSNTEDLDAD